jgi:hypothetical protein
MRSVLIGLTACLVAGCATVSMTPGEATVEAALSDEQTALRLASDNYCNHAADAGWVNERNGLADLARILMNGKNGTYERPLEYGERIGADTAEPARLVERITSDAIVARTGLEGVIREAAIVRDTGKDISRSDVTSFERALVRAQRARREFSAALEAVEARGAEAGAAALAIEAFAIEIDRARVLANDLLHRYAETGRAGA